MRSASGFRAAEPASDTKRRLRFTAKTRRTRREVRLLDPPVSNKETCPTIQRGITKACCQPKRDALRPGHEKTLPRLLRQGI
jgi:hypothetical protein